MVWRSGAFLGALLVFVLGFASPAGSRQEAEARDPFSWPAGRAAAPRPPGLAGVRISETAVRGVLILTPEVREGRPRGLAVLETAEGVGFIVAPGDRLLDGFLERVEIGGAVFRRFGEANRELFAPVGAGTEPVEPRGSAR